MPRSFALRPLEPHPRTDNVDPNVWLLLSCQPQEKPSFFPSSPSSSSHPSHLLHTPSPHPKPHTHTIHTLAKMVKATVIGAAGGIGQPLSLLLKQSSLVTDLALYDV